MLVYCNARESKAGSRLPPRCWEHTRAAPVEQTMVRMFVLGGSRRSPGEGLPGRLITLCRSPLGLRRKRRRRPHARAGCVRDDEAFAMGQPSGLPPLLSAPLPAPLPPAVLSPLCPKPSPTTHLQARPRAPPCSSATCSGGRPMLSWSSCVQPMAACCRSASSTIKPAASRAAWRSSSTRSQEQQTRAYQGSTGAWRC